MTLNVSKEFVKKYGKVVKTADEVFEKQKDLKVLTTVPKLDLALGGGIEEGSWTLVTGLAKTGKTSLCLHMVLNAVREGRPVIYVDAEGRLKRKQLSGIRGLEEVLPKVHKISPPDDEHWSAEKFLGATEMLVKDPENKGCLVIIDSVSALIPQKELDADVSAQIRAGLPKMLGHWTKKMNQTVTNNRAMIVLIRHFIANTGPGMKTRIADGGNKIQYQADTIIDVAYTQAWKEGSGENEEQVGHVVNWDIVCSSLGASGKKAQSWLRYGTGIDVAQEYLMLGEDLGLIDRAGSWFTASFMENHLEEGVEWDEKKLKELGFKCQGAGKFRDLIMDNEVMYNYLLADLKEMLG